MPWWRILAMGLLLAGCEGSPSLAPPARETLPVVHLVCFAPAGQPIVDLYLTRAQLDRIETTLPCWREWSEALPAPAPSGAPLPRPSPAFTSKR